MSHEYHVQIIVTTKEVYKGKEGEAIHNNLHSLGFENVGDVNVGKTFDLTVHSNRHHLPGVTDTTPDS